MRQNFHERKSNSSILLLPSVIERVPTLIFAGDQDLICNHVGLEAMMQGMEWAGGKGFGVSFSFWTGVDAVDGLDGY